MGHVRKLIVIEEGCSDQECCGAVILMGGVVAKRLPLVGVIAVEGLDEAALLSLRGRYHVAGIEEDLPVRALGAAASGWSLLGRADTQQAPARAADRPPDARLDRPLFWRLGAGEGVQAARIPWGIRRVGAPPAWRQTRGAGVKVAIVDTGIDADHPDLEKRIAGGYSAVGGPWQDENGHGTHVAGTVAASGRPGGIYGVAPSADLSAVKVLGATGSGSLSDVIDGLGWCVDAGVHIANLSLGSPVGSALLEQAVTRVSQQGVLVVAAAGNSGPGEDTLEYPGAYPSVISVGAIDIQDGIAAFSSRGEGLDLTAPGKDILSTWLRGEYRRLSGTSMAAPHVTGVAALIWEAINARDARRKAGRPEGGVEGRRCVNTPEYLVEQVRRGLLDGAEALPSRHRGAQGWGVVAVSNSLRRVLG